MRISLLMVIAAVGLAALEAPVCRADSAPPATPAVESSSSSAPAGAATQKPDITVIGDRAAFATKISMFVNELTDFNPGDPAAGLARWQDPVCPLVTGLPMHHGEYILGRISEIAQAAGAPIGREKCRPNLFIIVSKQPEKDLRYLQQRHNQEVFGDAAPITVEQFIKTPRPVRTWYDTMERTPEGLPLVTMSFPGVSQQKVEWSMGALVVTPVRPAMSDGSPTNPWSQASHLVLNMVFAIRRVFVVVDPTKFKGVSLGQLADYVAMAGLAQIKLDTHVADDPTILALFDKGPQTASPGLTEWDQAFLKSVYGTEQKSVLQRSQIAHGMVSQFSP